MRHIRTNRRSWNVGYMGGDHGLASRGKKDANEGLGTDQEKKGVKVGKNRGQKKE